MSARPLTGRLQIGLLAWLATQGPTAFAELAAALGASSGALSQQLQRLEELGLVRLERGFLGRRPRTVVTVTPAGRTAYRAYLDRAMELTRDGRAE